MFPCITTIVTKKMGQVMVPSHKVMDLLRCTEASDLTHPRGLLGACIRDVTKRLPRLIQSTDCYLLLLFHMGINNKARSSLWSAKDYRALAAALRDSGAQADFSSVLPVKVKRD